jgi:hypothetical protein
MKNQDGEGKASQIDCVSCAAEDFVAVVTGYGVFRSNYSVENRSLEGSIVLFFSVGHGMTSYCCAHKYAPECSGKLGQQH